MQTKTYFASSVPAALEVARKELGEDAMLVTSKPASAASKPFGRLEVTFAYDAKPATNIREPVRRATSELEDIRQQISALRSVVGQGSHSPPDAYYGAESRLCAAGLEEDTAREIALGASRRQGDRSAALLQEVASRIAQAQFPELKPGETRTLALVGPPGRGKTTTLVKLAVRLGLAQKIPVRIYTAGAHGVGCQEQMARYATILGIPFQACESLDSLHLALNGDAWKGIVLIDTPGLSPSDRTEISDLARFFARRPEIEKHLVLRAEARSADMSEVVTRFKPMGKLRLLFTGLDEASGVGAMVDTLIRSGLPGVFTGTGQQIPEDLEELNVPRLARAVCGENAVAAMAA